MERSGPLARKTGLTRKTPLTRGAGLARGAGPTRKTPLARTAIARTAAARPASTTSSGGAEQVSPAVRAIVVTRAKHRCEKCGRNLAAGGGQVHHRRPRGNGGSRAVDTNQAANLLYLCLDCHAWIESYRTAAYLAGLLVKSRTRPATVPVLLYGGGRWFLDDAGGKRAA